MDMRLALYELAAEHRLDRTSAARLDRLAGWRDEPAALALWLPRGVAVLAAALGGLGVIFWLAANWDTLGRFGRFGLIETLLLVACIGAWRLPAARTPLGLVALLAIGGLFAYFGQTYQTGADPWQLFALWALLALPLCLALRSDVTWAPWALVVAVAISLWVHAHAGHRWRVDDINGNVHLIGWAAAVLLCAALAPNWRRSTGAGVWSLRAALTFVVLMVTSTSLLRLLADRVSWVYGLGLVVLGLLAVASALQDSFDVYGLSAAALGIDTLLVAGLVRVMFNGSRHGEPIVELGFTGLVAAALLAASVSLVLRLTKRADAGRVDSLRGAQG